MSEITPARVRFAPSPTGYLHIGGARTALYDYLLAKQTGGQFILRIEDTDQSRFVPDAVEEQKNSLRWLGIVWDEGPDVGGNYGPYIQSQRADIHRAHAEQLIEDGKAYYCFCTKERLDAVRREQQILKNQTRYDGHCRSIPPDESKKRKASGESCVVRFKNSTMDDFIILKTDGTSLYHLAAMVDDHLMGITHFIRGSEWLSSLPRHSLIIRAFNWQEPKWVHLSIFLKPSGKGKMSKRESANMKAEEGHSIFVRDMEELGYLPEAVLNWIVLMGWSLDDKTDQLSLAEMIDGFTLDRLNPSAAAVNFDKLDHFNGVHIRKLAPESFVKHIQPFFDRAGIHASEDRLRHIAPLLQERVTTLDESVDLAAFFFRDNVTYDAAQLVPKGMTASAALTALQKTRALFESLNNLNHPTTEPPMRKLAEELNLKPGQLFGILRIAITGQQVSPPLFQTIELLDRQTVFERIEQAEKLLKQSNQ
ncbi:MAG: glutamate--tRNA ligase [Chloroflexi bacterium]|nr:glutamate--tRNA ligase [Chloroflexota bacterium]